MEMLQAFFRKYTNTFGTIAALMSSLTIWLAQQGCLSTGDFAATCTIPWLPTSWMPYITGVFIVLTLAGKLFRPGGLLRSFFGGTAVVVSDTSSKSGTGTVTPEQVKTP